MDMAIPDFPSRFGEPASQRPGTFSYLPPFDAAQIAKQIGYLVDKGFEPAIEHVEPERAADRYWYLWKLPLFGERDAHTILAEVDACRAANPEHHVRLIGYDTARQTEGVAFVVYRGVTAS
jgi:ribulose-bisphosphate carboxylase small chain